VIRPRLVVIAALAAMWSPALSAQAPDQTGNSVRVGDRLAEDLVWYYPSPIPECSKIENLLSFYNEKVDIYVDGELEARPVTPWS